MQKEKIKSISFLVCVENNSADLVFIIPTFYCISEQRTESIFGDKVNKNVKKKVLCVHS